MTSSTSRRALPAAAAVAGAFFLVTAMAHVVVIPPPAPPTPRLAMHPHDERFGIELAEVRACMAHGDRSHEECLDEAEGKALIQRAEQLAQMEDRGGPRRAVIADDDFADTGDAPPARSDAR